MTAAAPFNADLVTITRKRFSTTQGEVLVEYAGARIEQYGDSIRLVGAEWQGMSDDEWIAVARREAIARGLATEPVPPFTPPASYAECKTLLGQTITCPDGAALPVVSCGMSGDKFHLGMGAADRSGLSAWLWSSTVGFESRADYLRRRWDAEWHALPQADRDVVEVAFPGTTDREDRATLKAGARLVTAAKAKLVKAGRVEPKTCGRCGGSGRFSYNQTDGDRCFGCSGSGKRYPTSREVLAGLKCEAA